MESLVSSSITVVGARPVATWTAPRCRFLANGQAQVGFGVSSFDLQRTRYGRCDTLSITLFYDISSASNSLWFDLPDPAAGKSLPDIDVQLQLQDAQRVGAQWVNVFQGIVDQVQLQPHLGQVTLSCRDYMAKLMDMRVQDAWLNQTGPEMMKSIIAAAGLTPNVQFSSGMEGQYWQIEHKRHSSSARTRFQTAFDLARYVANGADCDLYADGKSIVCKPSPAASDKGVVITPITYVPPSAGGFAVAPVADISLERDYLTAKGVVVHCLSWDSKQRIKSEVYFSALGRSKRNALENGTLHTFRFPGLKEDQLAAKAEMLYRQIIAHERTITLSLPGRVSLAPRQFVRLTGTGTTWDGVRDVDAVSSSMSVSGGYTQSLTLRTRDTSDQEGGEYD